MRFRIALTALALLVFGMNGVAAAQSCPPRSCRSGTLIFVHAVPAETLGPVELIVRPRGSVDEQYTIGTVAPGDTLQAEITLYTLAEPPNWLVVRAVPPTGDSLVLDNLLPMIPGGTTTIVLELDAEGEPELVASVQPPPPPPETASPRPQTVTVPTRVETGGGGSASDGARELVLGGLTAATVAGLLMLGMRRRSASDAPRTPRRSSYRVIRAVAIGTAGSGPRRHATDCQAGAQL